MVRSILFLALGIVIAVIAEGQSYPPRTPIAVPEFESYLSHNFQYVVGQIIPLGFSPEGKFAYVLEPPDEACGCYFFEFHVVDLNTDRDVFVKKVTIEGGYMQEWDQVWKVHGGQFKKELATHGIRMDGTEVKPLPIVGPFGEFNIRILGSWRDSDFGTGEKLLNDAYIKIGNEQVGEKRIASRFFAKDAVLGLEARYFMKSPYEERVAILFLRIDRGWEGPPNTVNWEVVGARLDRWF